MIASLALPAACLVETPATSPPSHSAPHKTHHVSRCRPPRPCNGHECVCRPSPLCQPDPHELFPVHCTAASRGTRALSAAAAADAEHAKWMKEYVHVVFRGSRGPIVSLPFMGLVFGVDVHGIGPEQFRTALPGLLTRLTPLLLFLASELWASTKSRISTTSSSLSSSCWASLCPTISSSSPPSWLRCPTGTLTSTCPTKPFPPPHGSLVGPNSSQWPVFVPAEHHPRGTDGVGHQHVINATFCIPCLQVTRQSLPNPTSRFMCP